MSIDEQVIQYLLPISKFLDREVIQIVWMSLTPPSGRSSQTVLSFIKSFFISHVMVKGMSIHVPYWQLKQLTICQNPSSLQRMSVLSLVWHYYCWQLRHNSSQPKDQWIEPYHLHMFSQCRSLQCIFVRSNFWTFQIYAV